MSTVAAVVIFDRETAAAAPRSPCSTSSFATVCAGCQTPPSAATCRCVGCRSTWPSGIGKAARPGSTCKPPMRRRDARAAENNMDHSCC
eukprot:1088455-Pleurochrysis_carterae.AAC.1